MIPKVSNDLQQEFTIGELPTNTYKLNILKDNITGYTDQLEAMRQVIYLILNVERYEYLIYSWNYGVELADLFGQPSNLAIPEIERRITEALKQDRRITNVTDFSFSTNKNKVFCNFKVTTIFGEIDAEKVVNI